MNRRAIPMMNGCSAVGMALLAACNITAVTFKPAVDDAGVAQDSVDPDVMTDAALGSADAPALSCRQLRDSIGPLSGVYWLRDDLSQPAFQAYCEQVVAGGGWAVLYNSVLRLDGSTTEFWNISYADRFATKGAPSISDNFYAGSMYWRGTSFLDVIADLDGNAATAARVDSQGLDPQTMAFASPVLMSGSPSVFRTHFAAGWSSSDFDRDSDQGNCASFYNNVTQHYAACWVYNLGSDADVPLLDDGVGPHVHNSVLIELSLSRQPAGGAYSRVNRITRYVLW